MSWQRGVLNLILRLTEKRYLARVVDPDALRARFHRRARLFFPPPRGVQVTAVPGGLWLGGASAASGAGPVILYFHGGAFVFGAPETHKGLAARLAQLAGLPVLMPVYRLAPEHPFPAALEDARVAYETLLARGVAPGQIVLGGDSAGGGLALALLGDLCARGADRPAGCFAFSPLSDLTFSGASLQANVACDVMLPAERTQDMAQMYLQGADPRDSRASPLFAGFAGAGPVWLTVGRTEIMLDDTRRMAAHLRGQGVTVAEVIAGDLPHVWPFFWRYLPEGEATLRALAGWIRQRVAPSAGS
ncbi:alpha/beta hydrolase fold domain-containing protein [Antarcticimicrobium sediminis]|uniref:Steryl acetyl hydrolase n=1 Tax=Antarcticimicrobium sediminis TaxID=2546227 RepID=A0A4R5EXC1_9RHOB|nr:alpha/beta hydrolase fold domain-containing protein [Antarcticimicrobium sediminis]TDE39593.1 steryl acetyl hydrolase [Antarcticimicrobium sediminis]